MLDFPVVGWVRSDKCVVSRIRIFGELIKY